MNGKTIAIIDDDEYIGNMVEEVLRREGYSVLRAYSGTEALYLLENHQPDIILLDLMLPGLSGEEVIMHIQNIPVIIISAKVDVDNKVELLLGGAADYMTKPFDIKELLARITVQLRKNEYVMQKQYLSVGDLKLNTETREVMIGDEVVHLTRTEFAILKLLMKNPMQVIAKSTMLERISMDTPDCTESSLKVHMSNLRQKLRNIGKKDYIEAVWGIGFKMVKE